jgi:hypothetical protein
MNPHTYKLHPGRMIERDGLPWVTIHKCESCSPSEADDFTREIVRALEARDPMAQSLRALAEIVGTYRERVIKGEITGKLIEHDFEALDTARRLI